MRSFTPGYDFISTKDFEDTFAFPATNALFKIGGYVKLDVIQDFNAIDSQDFFNPGTIPVDAPQRTNSRFHARQTRLNIDTPWLSDFGPTRVFVEGTFLAMTLPFVCAMPTEKWEVFWPDKRGQRSPITTHCRKPSTINAAFPASPRAAPRCDTLASCCGMAGRQPSRWRTL